MSDDPDAMTDWSGVTESMARQILSQSEYYLQAQLQSAIASDSRATAMAGLFVTLALAAFGGGLGYWNETEQVSPLIAGLSSGGLLTVAAIMAAWAARPVDFFFPGNVPDSWLDCRKNELAPMLGYEAENNGAHIAANDLVLGGNQQAIRRAYLLAVLAPIAGVLGWLAPLICSFSPAATA